jgi:hypothetical protein
MHVWSAILGVLGLSGTGIWVGYHSRQRQQFGSQRYWFVGLTALLPAWLLAFVSVLTPPTGQGAFVALPIAGLMSTAAGLLGVIFTDWAVRCLHASERAHAPVLYWLLGVAALTPAWGIALVSLFRR